MPRELTWFDRGLNKLPEAAPEAGEERVVLRVPIEPRREAPRFTIPRLAPPDSASEAPAAAQADRDTAPVAPREAAPAPERPAAAAPRPSWPAPREELEALVARGMSNQEIAELYGVPRYTVVYRLSRLGIRRTDADRQALQQRGGRKSAARRHAERQAEPPADQGAPELDPDRALELFFRSLARAAQLAQVMGVAMEVSVRVGRAS